MAANASGGPAAAAADGDGRRIARVVVRLAAVRSALAEVSDGQGAALLVSALRDSPRALLVGQAPAAAPTPRSAHGEVVPGYALEARLTGIDAPRARHRPRVDAVIVDLTAWDWLQAQALDSLTVLRRVSEPSRAADDHDSLRAAVGAAVADAVSQLVQRLAGGYRSGAAAAGAPAGVDPPHDPLVTLKGASR